MLFLQQIVNAVPPKNLFRSFKTHLTQYEVGSLLKFAPQKKI